MIMKVIKTENGNVLVFDEDGEEMPKYQGRYEQVRDAILRDAPPEARFFCWYGNDETPTAISRSQW